MVKILIVDPLSELGHKNFNTYFLNLFSEKHQVSFFTKEGYLDKATTKYKTIYFPTSLFNVDIGRFTFRIRQILFIIRVHKYIKREKDYDLILFTSYETISFAIATFFLNIKRICVIEHNNIDQSLLSVIKECFYRLINKRVYHIVFEKYIANFIQSRYSKKTLQISHPFYESSENPVLQNKIIFSPSSTYDQVTMEKLISFCIENEYFLIAKGKESVSSNRMIMKPFFNDYYQNIKKSTLVFISNMFTYRVSGVAFEALAYNCPIVGFRSLFLEELYKQYPSIVFVIDDINEIKDIKFNPKDMLVDFQRFKKEHGKPAIIEQIRLMMSN